MALSEGYNSKTIIDFSQFVFVTPLYWADDAVDLNCNGAVFLESVLMSSAKGTVSFREARFTKSASFYDSAFTAANFQHGEFTADVTFAHAHIKEADFTGARFNGPALFDRAVFWSSAMFKRTDFGGDVSFVFTDFGATHHRDPVTETVIADLVGARFRQPELARFYRVNSRTDQGFMARFLNCDIEGIHFVDVKWNVRQGRLILQDELDLMDGRSNLWENGEPLEESSRELVAVAYRQLLSSFEQQRAYDLAEASFISVMEVKLHDRTNSRGATVALQLYKGASLYGSSYTRALGVLLLLVLVLFPAMFALPIAGVEDLARTVNGPGVQTHHVHSVLENGFVHALGVARSAGVQAMTITVRSVLVSLETATFQRRPRYHPVRVWGRSLAVLETLLVPAQLALLLLALRRRFRMS